MNKTETKAWEFWFSVLLILTGGVLFLDAGPSGIGSGEIGSGFLPKVAAVALIGFAMFNILTILRAPKPIHFLPRGYALSLVVLGIGLLGILIFQQLGMLLTLFCLFFSVLSLFERKLSIINLGIAVLVAYTVHGFFIGLLGIWDPAGNLIDLRWLTPW